MVCARRCLMTGVFCSVSSLSLLIRCPLFSASGSSWSSRYSPRSHGLPFPSHTINRGPKDHQPPSRVGASSFACTASLFCVHLWFSFHASSVLAPHSSLNLPPLLGSPYQTPFVPSSVTTRSRCVFARCAASYLPVLILPIFRATFVALPSSPDQRLVPTSSIPTSSHFIINLSAKAHPQFVAAESSRTHRRRASGPRWRDRQTCPHSR